MAAANARIGVAKAAFFPRISLTGLFGFESSDLSNLFKWSSRTWLLGPLVGTTIAQTVFDGGRNSANLAGARAAHEESAAHYRQTVLVAFREVEDSLADVRWLSQQGAALDSALAGARRAQRISRSRYDAGAVDYLTVIDADRTVLHRNARPIRSRGCGGRNGVAGAQPRWWLGSVTGGGGEELTTLHIPLAAPSLVPMGEGPSPIEVLTSHPREPPRQIRAAYMDASRIASFLAFGDR
jgi:hypothetical protein